MAASHDVANAARLAPFAAPQHSSDPDVGDVEGPEEGDDDGVCVGGVGLAEGPAEGDTDGLALALKGRAVALGDPLGDALGVGGSPDSAHSVGQASTCCFPSPPSPAATHQTVNQSAGSLDVLL